MKLSLTLSLLLLFAGGVWAEEDLIMLNCFLTSFLSSPLAFLQPHASGHTFFVNKGKGTFKHEDVTLPLYITDTHYIGKSEGFDKNVNGSLKYSLNRISLELLHQRARGSKPISKKRYQCYLTNKI